MDLGVDLIQVRERDLAGRDLEQLVGQIVRIASRAGRVKVFVNDRVDIALSSGADGVQLPASGIPVHVARQLLDVQRPGFLIGASCHGEREARSATSEGADFVLLGPIFESASKPGHPGLGLDTLAAIVQSVEVPVFALGGIRAQHVGALAEVGVAGVAGISAFLDETTMQRLLEEVRRYRVP